MDKLIQQLKRHEGYRQNAYRCPAGKVTIGYGYNLEANPLHLSSLEINHAHKSGMDKIEAERLLKLMVSRIIDQLEVAIPFINQLGPTRQDVLINMTYNLGLAGLLKFKKMLAAVKSGQYEKAAEEMLNSKWRSDVGDRAQELSMQMATGVYANVN